MVAWLQKCISCPNKLFSSQIMQWQLALSLHPSSLRSQQHRIERKAGTKQRFGVEKAKFKVVHHCFYWMFVGFPQKWAVPLNCYTENIQQLEFYGDRLRIDQVTDECAWCKDRCFQVIDQGFRGREQDGNWSWHCRTWKVKAFFGEIGFYDQGHFTIWL